MQSLKRHHGGFGGVELQRRAIRCIGNDARFQSARSELQPMESLGRSRGEYFDKAEGNNKEEKRYPEHDAFLPFRANDIWGPNFEARTLGHA